MNNKKGRLVLAILFSFVAFVHTVAYHFDIAIKKNEVGGIISGPTLNEEIANYRILIFIFSLGIVISVKIAGKTGLLLSSASLLAMCGVFLFWYFMTRKYYDIMLIDENQFAGELLINSLAVDWIVLIGAIFLVLWAYITSVREYPN